MDKPTAILVFNNLIARGYQRVSLTEVDAATYTVSYAGQIAPADIVALAQAVPAAQITATNVTIS